MATVGNLAKTYSSSSVVSETPSVPASEPAVENMSPESFLAADRKVAEAAFERYCNEGVLTDENQLQDFDIIRWWEVSAGPSNIHQLGTYMLTLSQRRRYDHELVFRVALDVLPAQASAVPCERVFSSAKETDTLRRNGLKPVLMEALQICKYALKSERLDFRDDWVAQEEEPTIKMVDVGPDILHTMLSNRELEKLEELIENAYKGVPLVYT